MRKKKAEVGTWYAERRKFDGYWMMGNGDVTPKFTLANLSPVRTIPRPGWEIVPVRCRPLTSKKRNPKRTR